MTTHNDNPADRLDDVLQALRAMPAPGRPADADVLALITPRRRNWMRTLTRWSVAAGVLIAAATVYVLSASSSVALADVVKAAEKHKLVKYKLKQTTEDKDSGTGTSESVLYADLKAPRYRTEGRRVLTLNGAVESVHYSVQDAARGVYLGVTTETVIKGADTDEALAPFAKIFTDQHGAGGRKHATLTRLPKGDAKKKNMTFLDSLRDLQKHKDITVTKDKLAGREAVRYYLEQDDGKTVTKLWVDAKTKLPLRYEVEWTDPTPSISSNALVFTDFEWGPELPKGIKSIDDLFDTTPPKGYKLFDYTKDKEKTKAVDD